jgi:hypothetical protein
LKAHREIPTFHWETIHWIVRALTPQQFHSHTSFWRLRNRLWSRLPGGPPGRELLSIEVRRWRRIERLPPPKSSSCDSPSIFYLPWKKWVPDSKTSADAKSALPQRPNEQRALKQKESDSVRWYLEKSLAVTRSEKSNRWSVSLLVGSQIQTRA